MDGNTAVEQSKMFPIFWMKEFLEVDQAGFSKRCDPSFEIDGCKRVQLGTMDKSLGKEVERLALNEADVPWRKSASHVDLIALNRKQQTPLSQNHWKLGGKYW